MSDTAASRRDARGNALAFRKHGIKITGPHTYDVRSSRASRKWYSVINDGEEWTCACKDFARRAGLAHDVTLPCKHIVAVRAYKSNPTIKNATVPPTKQKSHRNWAQYNDAQKNEEREVRMMLRALIDEEFPTVPGPRSRGRPRIPEGDLLFGCVMSQHRGMSLRRFGSSVLDHCDAGFLSAPIDHSTLGRFLQDPETTPLLHQLIGRSACLVAGIEHVFAVDSSGFRSTTFGTYLGEKHLDRRGHLYRNVHVIVGVKSHLIVAVIITDCAGEDTGDSSQFPELLKIAESFGFKMETITADMAYEGKQNYEAAHAAGARLVTQFRKRHKGRQADKQGPRVFDSSPWAEGYRFFRDHPEAFQAVYHQRSNVESVFSALKTKFGEKIRSRSVVAQDNELLCRILAYNLSVICDVRRRMGSPIPWARNGGDNSAMA